MPAIDFRKVRETLDPYDVLYWCSISWKIQPGGQLRMPCPYHCCASRQANRVVAMDGQSGAWFCHRCNAMGDLIDLYALTFHKDLFIAAKELCQLARIPIPWINAREKHGFNIKRKGNGEEAR